jgi:hypothetical protein
MGKTFLLRVVTLYLAAAPGAKAAPLGFAFDAVTAKKESAIGNFHHGRF